MRNRLIYRSFVPNRSKVVLKYSMKIGTKWTNDSDSRYESTGVNVKIETPGEMFNVIEVTYARGENESKPYYAKDIGFVKRINGYVQDEFLKVKYMKEDF